MYRASLLSGLSGLLLSTAILIAQTPNAAVTGSVVDQSGATVPEATVTVVNQETNVSSTKTTAADGAFTIINLVPGNYTLTVSKAGFKTVKLPVFKLDVNQTLTEKITLEVGETSQTVEVSANAVSVMLQRSSTELGTTIGHEEITELPLNGRNFTQLLILQRGGNPIQTGRGDNGVSNPYSRNTFIPHSRVLQPSVNCARNRSKAGY